MAESVLKLLQDRGKIVSHETWLSDSSPHDRPEDYDIFYRRGGFR